MASARLPRPGIGAQRSDRPASNFRGIAMAISRRDVTAIGSRAVVYRALSNSSPATVGKMP
jgi:hypothetical protein